MESSHGLNQSFLNIPTNKRNRWTTNDETNDQQARNKKNELQRIQNGWLESSHGLDQPLFGFRCIFNRTRLQTLTNAEKWATRNATKSSHGLQSYETKVLFNNNSNNRQRRLRCGRNTNSLGRNKDVPLFPSEQSVEWPFIAMPRSSLSLVPRSVEST